MMKNHQLLLPLLLISGISSTNGFRSRSDSVGIIRKRIMPEREGGICGGTGQLQQSSSSAAEQTATTQRRTRRNRPSQQHSTTAPPSSNISNNNKFKNFEEVLAAYQHQPLMVMFTAVNCGPCRLMKKEIKQVRETIGPDQMMVFALDTEQYPHVGSRFEVAALPCLLIIQNEQPILRIEGVQQADAIVQQIQTVISVQHRHHHQQQQQQP